MSSPQHQKGSSLELQTAAYFQSLGFLVRRGVTLSISAGTADITDIDVLALRFNLPLAEERLVADCKDRKKPRPFERVLWTRGLASFSHADRSVVVLPRAPWQAREFGAEGGVEILETDEIRDYLNSQEKLYQPFGEADPTLSHAVELRKKRVLKQDESLAKNLAREDLRLRQMLVKGHPLTNLNRVIRILSSVGENISQSTVNTDWLKLYVCFNAAVVASVMLVRFATENKWTPESDWSDYARKRLTYGDVPPQKARQLAKLALDHDFFEGLPSPEYTDEIIEIIKKLIAQPKAASAVPYALDFRLLGQTLGGEESSITILGELQEDADKIGRQFLSALAYSAAIRPNLWYSEESRRVYTRSNQPQQSSLPEIEGKNQTNIK
jgi:hypothetical protein